MQPRTSIARFACYVLLVAGSIVFLFPFAWLICTSLKPIEQTMQMPPSWIPRAYYVTLNRQRTEVTLDYPITEPSVIVVPSEGRDTGKRLILSAMAFDPKNGRARLQIFEGGLARGKEVTARLVKRLDKGSWHVTELSPTKIRPHELAWDVVPLSEIESHIRPRCENYPMALKTMGGRSLEEAEGTVSRRATGIGEDTDVSFTTFLRNTLWVCVLGVIGAVISNAVVAYGFAKIPWRGRNLIFAVTLATMMVPFPVVMVPLYGVFKTLGWIGTLRPLWVPAFFCSAFNIFLMRQFFLTIPKELSEAARIDGCSEWGIFWRVMLPLSKPVLAVVALFHFLYAWNDFMGPLLFLTRKHTFTLAVALQNYQSRGGGTQWHHLMAASAVVIVPIIILFFFTQKTFIKGIATTGIKG